ncbi:MAG: hypothetical protein E6J34_03130 [Chloroflexi bacterium]|nr:MAG: hypothetical protein E6J34_03130 [Chloroflexota bacterium]
MYAFLDQFVERECPVIPVLLKSATERPKLPPFLALFTWVDFHRTTPRPLDRLVWGIKQERPGQPEEPVFPWPLLQGRSAARAAQRDEERTEQGEVLQGGSVISASLCYDVSRRVKRSSLWHRECCATHQSITSAPLATRRTRR